MSSTLVPAAAVSARTRLLAYGLLGFCVVMSLFGPQVAEFGLAWLGCPAGVGGGVAECSGVAGVFARMLSPWLLSVPPVDSVFLLLERFWALIVAWTVLIAASMRSDRRGVALPARTVCEVDGVEAATRAASAASTLEHVGSPRQGDEGTELLARWQGQQQDDQRSRVEQLRAQGVLWTVTGAVWLLLLAGFIGFCATFGLPVFGGVTAERILHQLGCAQTVDGTVSACHHGFGGFWSQRLEPYTEPRFGALLSPLWLVTQFLDVLLGWIAVLVILGGLLAYRLRRIARRAARMGDDAAA